MGENAIVEADVGEIELVLELRYDDDETALLEAGLRIGKGF